MQTLFGSTLLAAALGLAALIVLPESANADSAPSFDYRIIGCEGPSEPPVPPFEPSYTVSFSSSASDVGQPCEDVLTALGNQGFRLVEVRTDNIFQVGNLHYLKRRNQD